MGGCISAEKQNIDSDLKGVPFHSHGFFCCKRPDRRFFYVFFPRVKVQIILLEDDDKEEAVF